MIRMEQFGFAAKEKGEKRILDRFVGCRVWLECAISNDQSYIRFCNASNWGY